MGWLSQKVGNLHHKYIFLRRQDALCSTMAPLLCSGKVLDVGAGNGMVGAKLMALRPDVMIKGIDVHIRPHSAIEILEYDGITIPYADNTFDSVIIVDVLHHTDDYQAVLAECLRVSCGNVIVKDHFSENFFDLYLLKILDWGGNRTHGVRLPYNYFSRAKWLQILNNIGVSERLRQEQVENMYPWPIQNIIGQGIQFVSELIAKE